VSREQRDFVVLGFGSTHDALSAEALLRDLGIDVVPVPPPQELDALCGIALRLEPTDAARAKQMLERAAISWTSEAAVRDV
jgi:hypothetical protein